ncbi:zinc finger, MYND-type [Artemisia annua]|uniref:ubiquitinyl hydrolase 1 n=1 Tax=Artemisia annua TaxID=35608 RepID=A0A2U1NVM9_ARTAN|nr:zinc finger, MYND-type [Artemisia annua]
MLVVLDLGLSNLVVLVVVFVILPLIGFIVRRKWRHALERSEEVKRLLALEREEADRAEFESFYGSRSGSAVEEEDLGWRSAVSVSEPVRSQVRVAEGETVGVRVSDEVVVKGVVRGVYQCAVCFSPTNTRCARCKAVRYCSGRCQIVHWRQGHKEECRPYVAVQPVKDEPDRAFKQGDGKDSNDSLLTENLRDGLPCKDDADVQPHGHQPEIVSVFQSTAESSSEEYSTFSTRSRSSTETSSSSSGDSEIVDEASENVVSPARKSSSSEKITRKKFELSDEDVIPRLSSASSNADDGSNVSLFSKPFLTSEDLVIPARKSTSSVKINQNKFILGDEDVKTRFSSASSHADDGSYGSSSPKPSMTPENLVSPAWKSTSSEKINQNKNKLSDEDVNPRFSSASSRAADSSNESVFSEPSTTSSDFWNRTLYTKKSTIEELNGFEPSISNEATTESAAILDNFGSNKKANDEISSSKEMLVEGLKSRKPRTHTSETLVRRVVVANRESHQKSMFKETKITPSGAGEPSINKDSKAVGVMPSAIPERSNHVVNKSTASPLSKSTSRLASQCTKPVTVDEEKNRVATFSSKAENSRSARKEFTASVLKVVDQLKPSKLSSSHSSLRAESETAHKYSCKGLFSYDMFVKLYNWKQVELRPSGLMNCGNSCYANAVLQCLTYTPPLNAYLLQGLHSKACKKRDWCFTCEFEDLVLKSKNGNSPLSPNRIYSQIENIGSNLGHGREEDAHEFLRYAIDIMQSVCLKEAETIVSNPLEEETTLIGLTFGGYLRSKIKCMKCGGKSEKNERMMDLTVEIEGDIGTLEEALKKYTSTELLDGENKYKCSRCKSNERAKKKLTILEAPNVLTIALKRFQSGKFGKLNKSIHFPEILDMAPYMSGTSDMSPVYRLYGVVVHLDKMNAAFSGHYVSYIKNIENRWFKTDDSKVKEVDVKSVLAKGAYMLLYARYSLVS